MGANASNIENHSLSPIHDSEGNAFPSGATFYLQNLCSNFQQTIQFDSQLPGARTTATRDIEECKWQVEYAGNDRTKVAFKNLQTGQYLAASKNALGAPLMLTGQQTVWYVYQGGQERTFWLSTSQFQDAFLATWDNVPREGADVGIFTNRAGNSGKWLHCPYSMFEEWSSGLSWRLEPAPEYWKWKAQQRGEASDNEQTLQKRVDELEKQLAQENQNAARADQLQKDEAEIKAQQEKLEERDRNLAAREEAAAKSAADLKKQETSIRRAEQRVKNSNNSNKADHLAAQEERDSAKDEKDGLQEVNARLVKELAAARDEAAKLRKELEQAKREASSSGSSGAKWSSLSSGFGSNLAPLRKTMPAQKLPTWFNGELAKSKLPPVRKVKPAQNLPKNFDQVMVNSFKARQKSMKVN